MASNTPKAYRNQVMYSAFVRTATPEGTFEGLRRDLTRIHSLGTDVIWLMPIHPIGASARKGTLGSPYAIRDYRAVNPEFGTLEDFRRLVDDIHALGMKCIIDVVYNHTSPDSVLAQTHPEWFYHKPDGAMGNRIGAWSDVLDLDYANPALWTYQLDTLKYWATLVDGFRCDVAPLVPLAFWLQARAEVEQVHPGSLWLAESGEPAFLHALRRAAVPALTDSELYQAFDLCYDYDIFDTLQAYLEGTLPLETYLAALNQQEILYPDNYIKLRFLENHDRLRSAFLLPREETWENWTAFLYFQRGMTLLYAGQEVGSRHTPSLFDKDPVDWTAASDRSAFLRRLSAMKRDPLIAEGSFHAQALPRDTVCATYRRGPRQLVGVFSLRAEPGPVPVPAPDGTYENLAGEGTIEVKQGRLSSAGRPIIFSAPNPES